MTSTPFKDQIALISGAGSGIGLELAKELGRRGAAIIGTDLNDGRIQSMTETLGSMGIAAKGYIVDHTRREDVARLADEIAAEKKGVDILCCNAGVGHGGRIETISLEDWKWVMDINLWGAIFLVHYFLPSMLQKRKGHILITASGAGLFPIAGMAPYCMSKSAMVTLAHTLRMELKVSNINVTALCPGIINTNIIKDGRLGSPQLQSEADTFYRRWGVTADKVARAAVHGLVKGKAVVATPRHHVMLHYLLRRLLPGFQLKLGSAMSNRGWNFIGPFLKN